MQTLSRHEMLKDLLNCSHRNDKDLIVGLSLNVHNNLRRRATALSLNISAILE